MSSRTEPDVVTRRRTYLAYSIGCAIVWLVLLGVVSGSDPADTRRSFWLVSGGWWIGWLSATIARAVYPATKAQQRATSG
jgi:hypothetical protein